ncbi:hypothetical protein P7C73_g4136, partial [Tremellales sp. Uapishka_1]
MEDSVIPPPSPVSIQSPDSTVTVERDVQVSSGLTTAFRDFPFHFIPSSKPRPAIPAPTLDAASEKRHIFHKIVFITEARFFGQYELQPIREFIIRRGGTVIEAEIFKSTYDFDNNYYVLLLPSEGHAVTDSEARRLARDAVFYKSVDNSVDLVYHDIVWSTGIYCSGMQNEWAEAGYGRPEEDPKTMVVLRPKEKGELLESDRARFEWCCARREEFLNGGGDHLQNWFKYMETSASSEEEKRFARQPREFWRRYRTLFETRVPEPKREPKQKPKRKPKRRSSVSSQRKQPFLPGSSTTHSPKLEAGSTAPRPIGDSSRYTSSPVTPLRGLLMSPDNTRLAPGASVQGGTLAGFHHSAQDSSREDVPPVKRKYEHTLSSRKFKRAREGNASENDDAAADVTDETSRPTTSSQPMTLPELDLAGTWLDRAIIVPQRIIERYTRLMDGRRKEAENLLTAFVTEHDSTILDRSFLVALVSWPRGWIGFASEMNQEAQRALMVAVTEDTKDDDDLELVCGRDRESSA